MQSRGRMVYIRTMDNVKRYNRGDVVMARTSAMGLKMGAVYEVTDVDIELTESGRVYYAYWLDCLDVGADKSLVRAVGNDHLAPAETTKK